MHNTLGFVDIIFLMEKESAELNFPLYFLGLRFLKSDELLRSMKYLLQPKKFRKDLKHARFVVKNCLLKKSKTMSVTMRFLYLKILILCFYNGCS